MIFAAIDWLSISINLLLVVFVIVCLLMTLLILMQRPKQEGLGAAFGAGVTDQVFGARTTNVLQRGTVYLGSLFFILALTLAVLIGHKNKKVSMLQPQKPTVEEEVKQPEKPKEEVKPKSLSEELPAAETVPAEASDVTPPAGDVSSDDAPLSPESSVPAGEAAPLDASAETPEGTPEDAGNPPTDSVAPAEGNTPDSEEKSSQP